MPHSLLQTEKMKRVASILMGAAFADGRYEHVEGVAVRRVLAEMAEDEDLPAEVQQRIDDFDPDSFDLEGECSLLFLTSSDERKELLKMVAVVTDADDVHDLDESYYIVQVARCIGASEDEYAGLTIEILAVSEGPPPVPKS